MSEPFIGEIRAFPYVNLIPENWLPCDGSLYQVSRYEALFSVIGSLYGGDGRTTFQLPNMTGLVPMGWGVASNGRGQTYFSIGRQTGSDSVACGWPAHSHQVLKHPPKTAGTAQKVATPTFSTELAQLSSADGATNYNALAANTAVNSILSSNTLAPYPGASTPHENRQPYILMHYYIACFGAYPVRA